MASIPRGLDGIWESLSEEKRSGFKNPHEALYYEKYLANNHFWDETDRQSAKNAVDEMRAVERAANTLSIPWLLSALSQMGEGYFFLDRYGPTEMIGLDGESVKDKGYFKGITVERVRSNPRTNRFLFDDDVRRLEAYITMPDCGSGSVFKDFCSFLQRGYHSGNRLAGILADGDNGFFGTTKRDILIQVDVKYSRPRPGSDEEKNFFTRMASRNDQYTVVAASLHVGKWNFKQYLSPNSRRMGELKSLGYFDQVGLTVEGTKGLEELVIYTQPSLDSPPLYEIVHHEELQGMREGETWTDKELSLLEMMGLKDEIFIDTARPPRIMKILREATGGFLENNYNFTSTRKMML